MTLHFDRTTWTRVRFDEIALNVTDRVDDPSAAGVDRYVGLEHLDPGSMTVNRWGSPEEVAAQKLRFQPDDVIFGRRRAYQKKVAQADFEGICSAHALVLRARTGVVSPEFLAVFLSSDYFLDRAISISVGSLSPTVNWRDLARQEFDLPPLVEQHRIASLAWQMERHKGRLVRLASQLTDAREAFLEALMTQSSDRLVRLGDVLLIERGGSPRPIDKFFTDSPEGLNWIKIGDVPPDGKYITSTAQKIDPRGLPKTRAVHPGDLLLSNSMSFGRPYILRIQGCIHDGWLVLSDKSGRCDSEFLYYLLRSQIVQSQFLSLAGGSTVKNLNKELVSKVQVRLPEVDVQRRWAQDLESFDAAASDVLGEIKSLLRAQSALLRQMGGAQ